ncbi:MAG: uncharacterized protein KVP18_005270, partial [Porospora cf. gigantea A]|uniref:uncharacterized protein n=1 Tax=Porospora cf. gigantea A TaxID=2853593 RepID=UPI003559D9BB
MLQGLLLFLSVAAVRVTVNVPTNPEDLALYGEPIYTGECDPKISLVQVQDSTATFEALIQSFSSERVIENLVASLERTYGEAQYGMATFGDKPAPIHGYGDGWGIWSPKFDVTGGGEDRCYVEQISLHSLDETSSIWDDVKISGGKDFQENQFDAFGKAAIDPFFWESAFAAGRRARVAMLITDDFPHKGNNEPDIGLWGFDSSYRGTQKYYNTEFGSWFENDEAFRIVEDLSSAKILWPVGAGGKEVEVGGKQAYESFIICHDTKGMEDKDLRKKILKSLQEA